jgi:hypothetical protein
MRPAELLMNDCVGFCDGALAWNIAFTQSSTMAAFDPTNMKSRTPGCVTLKPGSRGDSSGERRDIVHVFKSKALLGDASYKHTHKHKNR